VKRVLARRSRRVLSWPTASKNSASKITPRSDRAGAAEEPV
jgi:hypothetical protein